MRPHAVVFAGVTTLAMIVGCSRDLDPESGAATETVAAVSSTLEGIETYSLTVRYSERMEGDGANVPTMSTECVSVLRCRRPNQLAIEATGDISMAVGGTKRDQRLKVVLVFDGKTEMGRMVVEANGGSQTQVFRLDMSEADASKPFDGWNLKGFGLLEGRDYVGTVQQFLHNYDYTAEKQKGDILTLSGKLNRERVKASLVKEGMSEGLADSMLQEPPRFQILVDVKRNLVTGYRSVQRMGEADAVRTCTFEDIQVNGQLDSDVFRFTVKPGEQVTDLTEQLRAQRKMAEGMRSGDASRGPREEMGSRSSPPPRLPDMVTPCDIAFIRGDDGEYDLHVIPDQRSSARRLTRGRVVLGSAAWAPKGDRIAYECHASGHEANKKVRYAIRTISTDGKDDQAITDEDARATDPAWSHDGRHLAFSSDKNGPWDIYAIDTQTGKETRLTRSDACDAAPSWSSDGKTIVFVRRAGSWNPRSGATMSRGSAIVSTGNDGANEKQLSPFGQYESPQFQPGGQLLAYAGNGMVYLAKADGSGATNLTEDVSASGLRWSPSGDKIAFTRHESEKGTIVSVVGVTGPKYEVRDFVQCGRTAPSWSADSGSLFVELSGSILTVDVTTGKAGQVKGTGESARFPMARPTATLAEQRR